MHSHHSHSFVLSFVSSQVGFLGDGRPVGVQLVGPLHADAAVLRMAAALEAALDVHAACPDPRRGTCTLPGRGPRTRAEAAEHHGLVAC